MLSKKALLSLALPFTFTSAYAINQVIPQSTLDMLIMNQNQSFYVLKDAKGTISGPVIPGTTPDNWFNLSPANGVEGVRTDEAYEIFGLPSSEDIIVAVVDSGVDVNHEDLQGKIWTNKNEIPNNNIDDDNNGYVDDFFGWNFIGGAKGMATIVEDASLPNKFRLVKGDPTAQVAGDSLEVTRELARMQKLKKQVEKLGEELTPAQAQYLTDLNKVVSEALKSAKENFETASKFFETYRMAAYILKAAGLETITIEAVRALESTDEAVLAAKKEMLSLLAKNLTEARLTRIIKANRDQLEFQYNTSYDPRNIVGDDYSNQTEKAYGNNDVIGPDSSHGTHCAGSIAAVRNNNLGMKGVATNVKIMAVRTTPNGDERDKDVANGIRYAVDNGAKIISMSFGKAYSPNKKIVDAAFKYAESKGVLVIHAAGNDHKNNDVLPSFPSRFTLKGEDLTNWIEVGASSYKRGLSLPAPFTNFGKKTVDIFAPGVDIYSTTPDNTYGVKSGTSMATPTVAGVAALVASFNPSLSATELKQVIMETSHRYPRLKVNVPSTSEKILFSELSRHGSIPDLIEAITAVK